MSRTTPRFAFSIRAKIALYQIVVAAMLIASALATTAVIERIDYHFDRTRLSRQQLDAVAWLEAHMNRYSENIAELLLLGRTEIDDLTEARTAVDLDLNRLAHLVAREMAYADTEEGRLDEQLELDRVSRMRALFERIDRMTERLLVLREEGKFEEAAQLFRESIEDTLDTELEQLVREAVVDEQGELARADARTNALEDRLQLIVVAVAVLAIAVSTVVGITMARALKRPLGVLLDGTRAIGEGDFAYRMATNRSDEFGALAAQFNATAAQLEMQRDELLAVQAGLEAEVGRRTGELEEANERLKRLDEMRMMFLAEISHELRTPLTIMRGEAEVALRGQRPVEDHREALVRVVQLAHQMSRLVDDLLFLARAEVGTVRFERQTTDLADVAEIALQNARVLAVERNVELDLTLPDAAVAVDGDAERLAQALLIVLDNAVKYADAGSKVDVAIVDEAERATVTVTNVGDPVPPQDVPYVFNRFYRGQRSARPGGDGAGLGLAIAKWIVDMHRGTIALASVGRQVTVTIRLPVDR